MRQPNPNILPEAARSAWKKGRSSSGYDQTVTAHCTLMTPMYGGGVTAGQVDCAMPIRASALRGQLRFWWRLLQCTGDDGEAFADSRKLFGVETDLWGGISSKGPQASRVVLQVKSTPVEDQRLVAWRNGQGFPAYALILKSEENPQLLKEGYSFEVALRFKQAATDQQRAEAIEALRWWASFSGVGARTRRGLGAVKVVSDDADFKPVSIGEVEAHGGRMILGQPARNAGTAWKDAVDALMRFRQEPNLGRNPGRGNHPGRSRWPEPDAIRRVTGRHARGHEPEHPVDGFYPRAAFGLPIVFHFKDHGDPPDHTLVPVESGHGKQDRMASPLILRPWFDGQHWRPAALLLPGWQERVSVQVGLDGRLASEVRPAWPEGQGERRRLAAQVPPMQNQGEDVLTAFMRFFEERTAGSAPSARNQRSSGKQRRHGS